MNKINLVPSYYNKRYKNKLFGALGTLAALAIVAVLVLIGFIPVRQINMAEQMSLQLDLALKSEELKEVEEISQTTTNMLKEKENIEKILEQIDVPSHITRKNIDKILSAVPKGVTINDIAIKNTDETLDIRGNSENVKLAMDYVVRLYGIDNIQDLSYTTSQGTSTETKTLVEYNIQVKLKSLKLEAETKVENTAETSEETEESGL